MARRRVSGGHGPFKEKARYVSSRGHQLLPGPRTRDCSRCSGTGLLRTKAEARKESRRNALAEGLCGRCCVGKIAQRSRSRCEACLEIARVDQASRSARS